MFSLLLLTLLFAIITDTSNTNVDDSKIIVAVEDVSSEIAILEKEISVNE